MDKVIKIDYLKVTHNKIQRITEINNTGINNMEIKVMVIKTKAKVLDKAEVMNKIIKVTGKVKGSQDIIKTITDSSM